MRDLLTFPFRVFSSAMQALCDVLPVEVFMFLCIVVVCIPFGLLLQYFKPVRSAEPHILLQNIEALESRVAALESASRSGK